MKTIYNFCFATLILTNLLYAQYTGGIGSGATVTVLINSPLPVELISFTSAVVGSKVILKWETQTETNNFGFEIQRSFSNDLWGNIGFVNGYGNSNSPKEYSFTDNINSPHASTLNYRLKQIDNDGQFTFSEILNIKFNTPEKFIVFQNYPNPFNPQTTIKFQVPHKSKVVIKIFDILGSELLEFLNKDLEIGLYEVPFNAENLPGGIYFYQVITEDFSATRKMVLLK